MATQISDILRRFKRSASRQKCPDCGAVMELVDWRNESGVLFVWYSCSESTCASQWLKTISFKLPSLITKVA